MKYILIISAVITLSGVGLQKANELSLKRRELEQIIDMLEEIERKIRYCESTLETIINEYGEHTEYEFAHKLSTYARETDFPEAWKTAYFDCRSFLDKSEKSIFASLGEKLGMSDSSSQTKLIDYTLANFKKALAKAEKNENEKKRLYIISGFAAGFAAAIMMI